MQIYDLGLSKNKFKKLYISSKIHRTRGRKNVKLCRVNRTKNS